jgi:hypothetical protein
METDLPRFHFLSKVAGSFKAVDIYKISYLAKLQKISKQKVPIKVVLNLLQYSG